MRLFYGNCNILLLIPGVLFLCVSAQGAEKMRKYDVPSGLAVDTLKLAAEQGQIELVFASGVIVGFSTEAVRGRFLAGNALDQMLKSTPLVAVPVSGGEAFGIIIRAKKGGESSGRSQVDLSEITTAKKKIQTEMKISKIKAKQSIGGLFKGLLVLVSTGASGVAQDSDDDEIFELSPFSVTLEDSTGYAATSTLAGTRIKTPLRDVGAAISVITPEFLEDTGSTDAATVLSYSLNTEVSGEQGNFAGGTNTTDDRVNPQRNGQRIRGLASASLTRGFFLTDIPFDSYNTDRVTINRGPNSLLFGVGSPGGVINNGVKRATLGKTFGAVSVRFGENGTHRETLDYNRVLVKDRLAVRIALLNEDTQFHQRPAYEEDQRFHVAMEAVLSKNENSNVFGRTILKGNFEDGEIKGTPVNVLPPTDGFSHWFSQTLDRSSIEAITGATLPGYVDNTSDEGGLFVPKTVINTLPGAPLNKHGFPNTNSAWVNIPIVWNNADATTSSVGLPGQEDVDGVLGRVLWNNTPEFGRGRFETQMSTTPYSGSFTPGFTAPAILDQRILNNEKLLITGTTNFVSHTFDAKNVSLEQELFNGKGGIELAFDEQSYDNYYVTPFNNEVRIDTASHLTNDQPNPNLGKALVWGTISPQERSTSRESIRATGFYEADFTEQKGIFGWLGKHVMTGLLNEQTIDKLDKDTNFNWDSIDASRTAADILTGSYGYSRRDVFLYNYVTESLLGSQYQSASDVRLNNPIDAIIPQDGDEFLLSWNDHPKPTVNPAGVSGDPADYVPGDGGDPSFYNTFATTRALAGGLRNEQVIKSRALSWQSKFWNDKIIGLVGWRNDKSINTGQAGTARRVDGWYEESNFLLSDTSQVTEGNTLTKSLVFHVPDQLVDLGRTNLSFHYNESENFAPESTRRNIRGEVLPSPSGKTKEYGVGMEFLDGRVSMRLSKYKMSSDNVDSGLTGALNSILTPLGATRWGLVQSEGADFDGLIAQSDRFDPEFRTEFVSYDELQQAIRSYLPSDIEALINARYEPDLSTPGATFRIDPIVGLTATRSFTSEGTEFELVGSPTNSWRISVNIGQQETVQSNTAPLGSVIANEAAQNMKNLGLWNLQDAPDNDADASFGSRFNSGVLIPIASAQSKDDTVSLEQREWRANFATNYDFKEGKFKGFGLGGAYRYQSKVATGYPLKLNPDGILLPVLDSAFYGPAEWNGDVWASYSRRLNDKYDWKIQLNIRNALGDDGMIPVVINPDGNVAISRNSNPRDIYLTNTFKF